jgi:hypothetical protein
MAQPPHSMALLGATRHLLLNCKSGLFRAARRRYHRAVVNGHMNPETPSKGLIS